MNTRITGRSSHKMDKQIARATWLSLGPHRKCDHALSQVILSLFRCCQLSPLLNQWVPFLQKGFCSSKINSHLSSWNSNCTPHPSWAFQHWQMDSSFLPIFAIANWQKSRQKHFEQTADPSQRISIRLFLPFTRRDESLLYPQLTSLVST